MAQVDTLTDMDVRRRRASSLEVGNFVLYVDSPGIARVARVDGDQVELEFFESVAELSVDRRWLPAAELRRCRLGVQTRVFLDDGTGWRAGRVVGGGPDTYAVMLPNSEWAVQVHEGRLRVRWERPLRDPLQVLLADAQETAYFRDARLPVRHLLLEERAATGSATGIMSAGVNLHPHQVDAALRIIQDPVQRYLLADEVGMGKTIQAGFVIRQFLIDDPHGHVGIIVPESLAAQWTREMLGKFHLDDFDTADGRPRFRVLTHEDPGAWTYSYGCALVVVDEAHLLATVDSPEVEPYATLERLAVAVPRLLLLSATPSMQSDATHLALLHLLDPTMYKWSELDRFRDLRQVHRRLGLAVSALEVEPDPENPELLAYDLDQVAELIPPDERFLSLRGDVMSCFEGPGLVPGRSVEDLVRAVAAVRTHVAETYRLHHRMIRHRRSRVVAAHLDESGNETPFELTGRVRPRQLRVESADSLLAADLVDDWLSECVRFVLDNGADPALVAPVAGIVISRFGGTIDDLVEVLEVRVNGASKARHLSPSEVEHLCRAPRMPHEEVLLRRSRGLENADGADCLAGVLIAASSRLGWRCVVFCGPGSLASQLADSLKRHQVPGLRVLTSIVAHPRESESDEADWRTHGGILVVDDSGDVGRNFQEADSVVHARVPWNPNLLEQRIGRVDRYGLNATAAQFVVTDGNRDGLHFAWLGCLVDGFRVFERSISALQEPVSKAARALWEGVVTEGVEHLLAASRAEISAYLDAELRKVAEMDALDAVAERDLFSRDVVRDMSEFESHPDLIEDAYSALLADAKGFNLYEKHRLNGSVTYESKTDANPLLSPRLMKRLLSSERSRTGVFDRWKLRGLSGVRLFRRGNPFVNGIENVLELDDRGQASAIWRLDPTWNPDPEVYFAFDFLVQADVRAAIAVLGHEAAVRRRADSAFPPFWRRIWLSQDMQIVTDSTTLGWLNRPYEKPPRGTDVNLSAKRASALHALFGGRARFGQVATECQESARRELAESSELDEICRRAVERAHAVQTVLAAQASARDAAGDLLADTSGLHLDRDLGAAILPGLADPEIQLMAVACVVRSASGWRNHVSG